MSYQVIARKFRPTTFEDVVGQDAIVKTLKNSLKSQRLAHAYLFCGLRGTGKTTLARLLAKVMNCAQPTETLNPCGTCSSCQDFHSSQALDFIEIDGASHRGIDDIKNIIDTLAYSSVHRYKIILIDEVHMLTKEAFNALLKTLEEPPEHVKFIFATTESHKVPSTILSRCQRFDLARISQPLLVGKLKKIAEILSISCPDTIFELVAERAEGSLRDAESLFERVIAQGQGAIKLDDVYDLLGFFNLNLVEELDLTIGHKNIKNVFILAEKLFSSGKDVKLFFDQYRQHLRHIVCSKLGLSSFIKSYPLKSSSSDCYSLSEANYLIEVVTEILRSTNFDKKIDTEALLLHMVQSKNRASLQDILEQLESLSHSAPIVAETSVQPTLVQPHEPAKIAQETTICHDEIPAPLPTHRTEPEVIEIAKDQETLEQKPSQFYDTIMQFAAVELEGSLKK